MSKDITTPTQPPKIISSEIFWRIFHPTKHKWSFSFFVHFYPRCDVSPPVFSPPLPGQLWYFFLPTQRGWWQGHQHFSDLADLKGSGVICCRLDWWQLSRTLHWNAQVSCRMASRRRGGVSRSWSLGSWGCQCLQRSVYIEEEHWREAKTQAKIFFLNSGPLAKCLVKHTRIS